MFAFLLQEKLQNEMKKQKERSQKFEKDRRERLQKEKALKSPGELKSPTETKSPRLTSPPVGGGSNRTKSDSTSSKSDPDTTPQHGSKMTTTKERLKLLKEHQNQIMQDDRKRLRRMSEELGDPKIEKKPVVMLDNYLTSPEKGEKSQETSPRTLKLVAKQDNKNPPASTQGGDKNSVPTPSRTISLEKYRERKPLVPQPAQSTPTSNQSYTPELNPDKPSLAMEHLASIKLQGLKPLSEILKSSDTTGSVKKEDELSNASAMKPKLETPSPRKVKSEKLQRHDSSGRLFSGKNPADVAMGNQHPGQSAVKMEIKADPEPTKPHRTSQPHKPLSREPSSDSLQRSSKEPPSTSASLVKQTALDSPKKEKNIPSLKIKLGGKPVVTMSPGSSENKGKHS